ncbi:MAG: tRNA (adenosine(37)-N6)-threonylcarbamoyltransferase complex dimerization subunit type 1 TsaB, partial [Chloroflexota bacterium]
SEREKAGTQDHASVLTLFIEDALRRAGIGLVQLDAVAVSGGPGSYTGLRIGLALAKGLSLAYNLQLVGIPTLDILASAQPFREDPMLAVLQVGRGRVAAVWYKWSRKGWSARKGALTLKWEELQRELKQTTYICGELDPESREALRNAEFVALAPPALCVRRPSFLAELGLEKVRQGKLDDPANLAPIYLDTSAA